MGLLASAILASALSAHAATNSVRGDTLELTSPNGDVTIAFALKGGVPTYRVTYRREVLLRESSLGLDLLKGGPLSGLAVMDSKVHGVDDVASLGFGKASSGRNRYREATISLAEAAPPKRRLTLVFRAYDDAAAFRYVLPKQPALGAFAVREETTQFALTGDPKAYYLPLPFGSPYEMHYDQGPLSAVRLKPQFQMGLPILLEFRRDLFALITEANLTNYAGLYLVPSTTDPDRLESRLAPSLTEGQSKVRGSAPFESPWRVILVGRPAAILESNVIRLLNPPSQIADASWIKPGKTVFGWWNGYYMPDSPPFVAGVNTATIERFIDFAAAHGIAYATIDGTNDEAWYGGPVGDYAGQNVTKANPRLDMPEVLAYAKDKGVRIRLWTHWKGLENGIETAFKTYEEWGVSGVMVDFVNGDSQERVAFVDRAVEAAARHHLTINFHGMYKPTGRERTWPNLISYEGVLGTEFNKWDPVGSTPEHEILTLFARMPAGPLDIHQGCVRPIVPEKYAPANTPNTMGTLVRQLAAYVVYDNPLPMLADSASAYEGVPELLPYLRDVPTTWDETKVLAADVPHYLAIARRNGENWYVGVVTDREQRTLKIPLRALGRGPFEVESYVDGAYADERPETYRTEHLTVAADELLPVHLARAGGFVARVSPARPSP